MAFLVFCHGSCAEFVCTLAEMIFQCGVSQPRFALMFAPKSLALGPHPRWKERGILKGIVAIAAEKLQQKRLVEREREA